LNSVLVSLQKYAKKLFFAMGCSLAHVMRMRKRVSAHAMRLRRKRNALAATTQSQRRCSADASHNATVNRP
jgi:hypothetical protein